MFFSRVTTATRSRRPEADRLGKGGDEMSDDIALILAITLMVAVIRNLT
jgi:hypothetical protein